MLLLSTLFFNTINNDVDYIQKHLFTVISPSSVFFLCWGFVLTERKDYRNYYFVFFPVKIRSDHERKVFFFFTGRSMITAVPITVVVLYPEATEWPNNRMSYLISLIFSTNGFLSWRTKSRSWFTVEGVWAIIYLVHNKDITHPCWSWIVIFLYGICS